MQLARSDRVLSSKRVPYSSPRSIGVTLRRRGSGRLSCNHPAAAVVSNGAEPQSVVSHPSALLVPVTVAASVLLAFPAAGAAADFQLDQHSISSSGVQVASIHHEKLVQQQLPADRKRPWHGSMQWTGSHQARLLTHAMDTTSISVSDLAVWQHKQPWTPPIMNIAAQSRTLSSPRVPMDSCSNCDSDSSLTLVADGSNERVHSSLPPIPTTFPQLPQLKEPQIYQEVSSH